MIPIGGLGIILIYLIVFGIGFYLLLLMIKLIKRVIEALEVYIDKNKTHD
jgi:hypothetical protein